MSRLACLAGCPDPITVGTDETARCGCCGTKYAASGAVVSSPIEGIEPWGIEPGMQAEQVESESRASPTGRPVELTITIDGNSVSVDGG